MSIYYSVSENNEFHLAFATIEDAQRYVCENVEKRNSSHKKEKYKLIPNEKKTRWGNERNKNIIVIEKEYILSSDDIKIKVPKIQLQSKGKLDHLHITQELWNCRGDEELVIESIRQKKENESVPLLKRKHDGSIVESNESDESDYESNESNSKLESEYE